MNDLIHYYVYLSRPVVHGLGSLWMIGLVLLAGCGWQQREWMAVRNESSWSQPDVRLRSESKPVGETDLSSPEPQPVPRPQSGNLAADRHSTTGSLPRVQQASMLTTGPLFATGRYGPSIIRLPPVGPRSEIQRLPVVNLPPTSDPAPEIPDIRASAPNQVLDTGDDAEATDTGHEAVKVQETETPTLVSSPDTLHVHRTEVERIVQRAFSQANRGLCYSARREFLHALRMLAQARDAVVGGRESSRALTAGIRAMDEADDFRLRNAVEYEMDIPLVISAHHTPILRDRETGDISPPAAIEAYLDYATEQLGAAVAGEPAGSMALYGLARIHDYLSTKETTDSMAGIERAIVMHRAALLAHPGNHLAANEAGVLYARQGRLAKAGSMLQRAVHLAPTSVGFHNLAVVQRRQGLYAVANTTARQAEYLALQETSSGPINRSGVVWVNPEVLATNALPGKSNTRVAQQPGSSWQASPNQSVAPAYPKWLNSIWRR